MPLGSVSSTPTELVPGNTEYSGQVVEYQRLRPGWYLALVISMMEVENQDCQTDGQCSQCHCARQIYHCTQPRKDTVYTARCARN